MSWGWLWWLLPALLLFWSVGAYNRLMRLRAEATRAVAALDARWQQQIGLAQASIPSYVLADPGGVDEPWSALRSAVDGLTAALAALRASSLDPQRMTAALIARDHLLQAWLQVQQGSRDLAGDLLPESVVLQWQLGLGECEHLQRALATALERYNDAVAQFPALLLARIFGFQPGPNI